MRQNNWRHSTIAAGIISGILIGCGATALKHLIALISGLFVSGIHAHGANYILLAVPLTGIMLSGMMSKYVFKVPMEYATERIRNDISAGARRMKRRLTVAPILTSGVTLGCGGSAGAEGPIAYSGAAIANNVGRLFRIPANMLTVMIACGAGAGIAAIFKAPVGGMLFTIEVLGMELGVASILLLTAMCLISALTAFILSGYTPDLVFHETAAATDIGFLAAAAVLGIFCGLYSLYYLNTGLYLRRRLQHIAVPWRRNLIAGVILSTGVFCFPALYGEGYGLVEEIINGAASGLTYGMPFHLGNGLIPVAVGILLIKSIATYATNSGGGVAGDFAPTLFAGCIAGLLFASVSGMTPHTGSLALAGMAGVMAGAIRAPYMAIFLTVEMAASPGLLLPVTVTAATSYLSSKAFMSAKI